MKHLIIGLTFLFSTPMFPHGAKTHKSEGNDKSTKVISGQNIRSINGAYRSKIKPLFERSCFDCHSKFTTYPWYHRLPGIRSLIDEDVSKGRKHLDMSNDFPFLGHGTLIEDLEELKEVITENEMPPWSYKLFHWGSRLSIREKKIILRWISNSIGLLENK